MLVIFQGWLVVNFWSVVASRNRRQRRADKSISVTRTSMSERRSSSTIIASCWSKLMSTLTTTWRNITTRSLSAALSFLHRQWMQSSQPALSLNIFRCQLKSLFAKYWRDVLRIRDFLRMRYINWHFTYLLTYLLLRPHYLQCVRAWSAIPLSWLHSVGILNICISQGSVATCLCWDV